MSQQIEVLVVEDEPEMLRIYMDYLEAEGIPSLGLSAPTEGLRYVRERSPRVLVVDHQMPRITGLELLRSASRLREDGPTTILATADPDIDFDEAAHLGVSLVMFKPFRIPKLVSSIKSTLGFPQPVGSRRWVRVQRPIEVRINGVPELILDIGMGGFKVYGSLEEVFVCMEFEISNARFSIGAKKVWESASASGFQFLIQSETFKKNRGEILKWISEI